MAHIAVEHLTFWYPQTGTAHRREGAAGGPTGTRGADEVVAPVLRDVSLQVERGTFALVCGASGSGKTTLVRHLVPALVPHGARTGAVLLDGRDVLSAAGTSPLSPTARRTGQDPGRAAPAVAYVAQDPESQTVTDRVWHELAFGLENLGIAHGEMRARVAEMASYFGIADWFHRPVAELSGGQRQLLNLAAALTMQPEVLVLDEPTAQLDPIAATDFLNTVRRLNGELGITVVMTEHRLEDAYALADQVLVLESGVVCAQGDPRTVANALHAAAVPLAAALPTPTRVWFATGGARDPRLPGDQPVCPLTVREGRSWLTRTCEGAPAAGRPAHCGDPRPSRRAAQDAVPALRMRNVWLRYGKDEPDVLRDLTLEVPPATLYALVGANGAGKSTLLKAVCGTCKPQRGRIEAFGENVRRIRPDRLFHGCLALLPQNPADLFAHAAVRDELAEMAGGAWSGQGGGAFADPVARTARLCAVDGLLDRHPRDLSGGERQRVALAKVLLTEPRILLLDEPTKGLDASAKRDLARILGQLTQRGATVVMVSHDIEFCAEHADRVGLLFDGSIASEGTPRELFSANMFYTTAARRMGRGLIEGAVTASELAKSLSSLPKHRQAAP